MWSIYYQTTLLSYWFEQSATTSNYLVFYDSKFLTSTNVSQESSINKSRKVGFSLSWFSIWFDFVFYKDNSPLMLPLIELYISKLCTKYCLLLQGEWVISRVFQKSGAGSSSATGGGKKRPPACISTNPEVSSPSSVSLPALLEPSTASTDRENCSYDGGVVNAKEHVPCFSTTTVPSFNHSSLFETPPPSVNPLIHDPSSSSFAATHFPRHSFGVSAFPSLRSLQENLQLPFFFSAVAPPAMHGGADQMSAGYGSVGQWPAPENQKMGATEIDCMWSY